MVFFIDFLEAVAKALKNKDEKYLLEVMQVTSVWDMQASLNLNPELLPRICAQGFLNVLFHLLDVCELDITGKFQDVSGLYFVDHILSHSVYDCSYSLEET